MSQELIKAVNENMIEEVRKLLADPEVDPNYMFDSGSREGNISALHLSALKGHIEILELLLAHNKIKKDVVSGFDHTPLYWSVTFGQVNACKLLLPHINVLARGRSRKLAYFLAKEKFSLASGKDDRNKYAEIMNLLRVPTFVVACQQGDLTLVKRMIEEEKVNVNEKFLDCNGLYLACLNLNIEIINYLLMLPAIDVNVISDNTTALHILSRYKHSKRSDIRPETILQIATLLIEHGADVNAKDDTGITPLLVAVMFESSEMVKVLVDSGADINIIYPHPDKEKGGADILDLAKNDEILKLLKDYKIKNGVFDVLTTREKYTLFFGNVPAKPLQQEEQINQKTLQSN